MQRTRGAPRAAAQALVLGAQLGEPAGEFVVLGGRVAEDDPPCGPVHGVPGSGEFQGAGGGEVPGLFGDGREDRAGRGVHGHSGGQHVLVHPPPLGALFAADAAGAVRVGLVRAHAPALLRRVGREDADGFGVEAAQVPRVEEDEERLPGPGAYERGRVPVACAQGAERCGGGAQPVRPPAARAGPGGAGEQGAEGGEEGGRGRGGHGGHEEGGAAGGSGGCLGERRLHGGPPAGGLRAGRRRGRPRVRGRRGAPGGPADALCGAQTDGRAAVRPGFAPRGAHRQPGPFREGPYAGLDPVEGGPLDRTHPCTSAAGTTTTVGDIGITVRPVRGARAPSATPGGSRPARCSAWSRPG